MAKLHIVSVGGTGHKVLVSAIHLAACGAFRRKHADQISHINVISIDADNGNGNLALATDTFLKYKKLHQALNCDDSGLISIDSVVPTLNISLFQDDKKSLELTKSFNFVQYKDASDEYELIHFLYTNAEIKTEFEEGFYGHTSIGAVIVSDVLQNSNEWKAFKRQISEDDLVVIVGSIFGGTGASCIPVVLEELKEKKKNGVGLATVILTPYFQALGKLDEDGALQPDSDNFDVKAKAALNYYEFEKKLNATHALYVIGEPSANYSYEVASRGGESQRNKSHPLELFAATAILDFVQNKTDRLNVKDNGGKVYVANRSFLNGEYCYTWKMLQDADKDLHLLMQAFMKSAVFYNKVLYPQLLHNNAAGNWEQFYKDEEFSLQTKPDENNNFIKNNIHDYFSLFIDWMLEIHQKNLKDIDPDTQRLKREMDSRVRLFNIDARDLFLPKGEAASGKLANFEKLVYRKGGRTAEKILAELNYNSPESGKGFPALFVMLKRLLEVQEEKQPKQSPEPVMTPAAFLSKENNADFGVILTSGSLWIECSTVTILGDIAIGLPNKVSDSFTANDVSIPSPWSIFVMNEMALTRGKYRKLNENAYNQWCGLIALLVLRKLNLYEQGHDLRMEALKINTDDPFFKTIVDLGAPTSHIFGKTSPDWLNCAAVKLGKHTLAFLAHNTLVCPAFAISKEAVTLLHDFAPTIVGGNGEFLHPTQFFADPPRDSNNLKSKYALSLVLERLKDEMAEQAEKGGNTEIANFMVNLLKDFIKDLGAVTQHEVTMPREDELSINSVVDVFNQLYIQEDNKKDLPFILKNTLQGKPVALLSLQMAGMSEAEIKTSYITPSLVYSQIRLDNIQDYAGKEKDGYELVYDQDLLCSSMVMRTKEQEHENAFYTLPADSISDYEIVWPVSEKLLHLYTADKLNKMLSIKREKDKVVVTLTLELMGKMRTHSVTKTYSIKNIWDTDRRVDDTGICSIFDTRRLPFWAVWPYKKVLNSQNESVWQQYSFFCVDQVYNNTPAFSIKPFFHGTESVKLETSELSTVNESLKKVFYRRCKELPDTLQIFEQTGEIPQYRGAVFLYAPEEKKLGSSSWNVGVDFGTTSTTVFYSAGVNDKPDFLPLLPEYRWESDNTDDPEPVGEKLESSLQIICNTEERDLLDKFFIDKMCLSQKGYTTTFEELNTTNDDAEHTLFDTGRIFWHNYKNFRDVNAVQGRREHLKTGIKWEKEKKWAARYLNQLLTQTTYRAIERGINEIHWFFSYPTSFSAPDRMAFTERLASLKDDLNRKTGIRHVFNGDDSLLTESIAAAVYFTKKHQDYSTFLCLDIGGGTSDISVWVNKEIKFQTSVKFASRDMFVSPLQKLLERDDVLEKVCTANRKDGIHTMLRSKDKGVSKDSIPFLIETVLFEYLDKFKKRLDDLQGDNKAAYLNFQYLVSVAYSGLIFYLANIITALLNKKTEGIDRSIHEIVLGLSGKGSRLIEWMPLGGKVIYKVASDMIKEKTGCEISFKEQFQKESAKTETAYGLICDLNENGRQKTPSDIVTPQIFMGSHTKVIAGDNTKEFDKNDFIPAYDPLLKDLGKLSVQLDEQSLADFDEFKDFLEKVSMETHNQVQAVPDEWYTEKQKKILLDKMKNLFNNQVLKDEKRFDPPFIVMLKKFLEEYSEYLDKKH